MHTRLSRIFWGMLLVMLGSGCGPSQAPATASPPAIVLPQVGFASLQESAEIDGCILAATDMPFFYQNWSAIVSPDGKDLNPDPQNNPRQGSFSFTLENPTQQPLQFTYKAYLYNANGHGYYAFAAASPQSANGQTWAGVLAAGESQIISFQATLPKSFDRSSAPPSSGGRWFIVITLVTQDGHIVSIRTPLFSFGILA